MDGDLALMGDVDDEVCGSTMYVQKSSVSLLAVPM